MSNSNIFLIGFMGTGKSTIAKELSEMLNLPVREMDEEIEKEQGITINEIFATKGEAHFRDLESDLVRRITAEGGQIVSCGGGVVVREENITEMKKNGKIFLLSATPETIYERLKDTTNRPILNGHMNVEYIEQLMSKRRDAYLQTADVVVSVDGKSVKEIAEEIARA